MQSAGAADLIIDINRLETDQNHRDDVERHIFGHGVSIDFSGVRNLIGFSLCKLGSFADVETRLKVIGDMVIDQAPDEAGRVFGAKVLSEFCEEYARHEFQVGALRSVLLGPKGLLAERDAALAECHAVRLERDGAGAERDAMRVERDAALAECHAVCLERDGAGAERDAVLAKHDVACKQAQQYADYCDKLRSDFDRLSFEQTVLCEWALADRDRVGLFLHSLRFRWFDKRRSQMNERTHWRRKGDMARDTGEWLKASRAYEHYLSFVPNDDAIWVQYGHVQKESGNTGRALVAYERSRQLNPDDSDRDLHLFHLWERICESRTENE